MLNAVIQEKGIPFFCAYLQQQEQKKYSDTTKSPLSMFPGPCMSQVHKEDKGTYL